MMTKVFYFCRPCQMSVEREQAATPTFDSMEKSLEALFNESVLSGYDGDLEDELESAVEEGKLNKILLAIRSYLKPSHITLTVIQATSKLWHNPIRFTWGLKIATVL